VDLEIVSNISPAAKGLGVVITSAGVTSGTWWRTTTIWTGFYLGASIGMISMFGAGIAMGAPKLPM
jgi:hypothetical protein